MQTRYAAIPVATSTHPLHCVKPILTITPTVRASELEPGAALGKSPETNLWLSMPFFELGVSKRETDRKMGTQDP